MLRIRILTAVLLAATLIQPLAADETLCRAYEEAARSMEFFALDDFLYGRRLAKPGAFEGAERNDRILWSLLAGQFQVEEGRVEFARPQRGLRVLSSPKLPKELLRHENARVRTLALAALFQTEDPQWLPKIRAFIDDTEPTFPVPQHVARANLASWFPAERSIAATPPMKPYTVGEAAEAMVNFYLERSGFFYGVQGLYGHPGFAEYWKARGERQYCAGWFEVRLDRATQGISPLRQSRRSRVQQIRNQINALPPIEREITLLALFSRRDLVAEIGFQHLIYAGRRLGPGRLMSVLHGDPLVDDPDMPDKLERVQDFVLSHAGTLLRPSDAATLLELGRESRRPDWFVAAAELRPSKAAPILHQAFDQCNFLFDQRAQTALALWKLAGPQESAFLLDWFFQDREPRRGRAPYRAQFVEFLLERFNEDDRRWLAEMLRDPRFERLDGPTLKSIVEGLNRNLLVPIVPSGQVEQLRHPLGMTHFDAMRDKAQQDYPLETEQLLATLAEWRQRLRASIPSWSPEASAP